MGAIEISPGPDKHAVKQGKGKHKPKRTGVRVDMTPMVDIAFLLLIFYMVTTVFAMPQSLELNLPPVKGKDPAIIAESKVLNLWVDSSGRIYWLHNESSTERMDLPKRIAFSQLRDLLIDQNRRTDKLVTLLKIDPQCRYDKLVDIVDNIQQVERLFKQADPAWSYRFAIDDITEWEIEQMNEANKAM
jgi:biopolymer transport protein ExbD